MNLIGKCGLNVTTCLLAGLTGFTVVAQAAEYRVGTRWFRGADADRDQQVSRTEADTFAIRNFLRLDRNNDGVATVEEIDQRLMEGLARQRERLLRRLDANRDRTISKEEIVARTGGMFTAIDADASGGISRDEMQTYRRTSRGARRTDRDKATRQ